MRTTDYTDSILSFMMIALLVIALNVLADVLKERLRRQQTNPSTPKTLLASGVYSDSGESASTKSQSSLGTSSYTRRRVLRARVTRRSKRNAWPWKNLWSKENRTKEKEEACATSNQEDSDCETFGYKSNLIGPDLPYIFPLHRLQFWADHIRYTTKSVFTYQSRAISPYDIRLLDTKLGVPYVSPPGSLYYQIPNCRFGLDCRSNWYSYRWYHARHDTRRIEAVRKAAREYHTLKKAGCLEKGHALGRANCCESPIGKSWERTKKRCDRLYQHVEDSEAARTASTFRTGNNKVLFYESTTALQCAMCIEQYPAKKHPNWESMSRTFDELFGFPYEDIWNKNPEDVKDMILFTCESF
ncbi:hypothetical protein VKT23_007635 [Stygiomarasmius scandens]|uniref:Uncharacterized protein n=1 Tax=Marasmiellus scandens TaxID=2682957 RepID=A0ABR1JRK9_9AGAR